jgi:hypothetical protein
MAMRDRKPDRAACARRLEEFVAHAKRIDSYEVGPAWPEPQWDITDLVVNGVNRTAHSGKRRFLVHFRRFRSDSARQRHVGEPFEEPFADFAKACVTFSRHQRDLLPNKPNVSALKCLYEALVASGPPDPTRFTRDTFEAAADLAEERYTTPPGYDMLQISDLVDRHALTPVPISWNNRWPYDKPDRYRHIFDGVDDDRMPSREALAALGELAEIELKEWDLALFRIVQLIVLGGFRIGEVLTLPLACWVERSFPDPVTGHIETRAGVRYWPEKSGETFIKWLPTVAVEVARAAIEDLTRIGAPAREQALRLERDSERVPLPGRPSGELITPQEFGRLIGGSAPHTLLKQLKVGPAEIRRSSNWNGVRHYFRVDEIERALNRLRPRLVVHSGDVGQQMLSSTLCVTFRNALSSGKRMNLALPRLFTDDDVRRALGALGQDTDVVACVEAYIDEKRRRRLPIPTHEKGRRKGRPHLKRIYGEMGVERGSLEGCLHALDLLYEAAGCPEVIHTIHPTSLFEKYDKTSEDGAPLKIRPHQLRHWVNTLAARGGAAGGMTLVEMSVWFGRRNVDETLQYIHLDLPARIRWLEREIEAGAIAGPFIDAVRSIDDPERRREFIRLHAGRVHITPYGLCIHDFDAQPCPYHLVCIKGCKMFIRIKGRKDQRRNIEALLAFEEEKVAQLESQGASDNWLIDAKATVEGCRRALQVDGDESIEEGARVRVFPEGKALGKPAL